MRRLGLICAVLLGVALAGQAQSPAELCADTLPGVTCGSGDGRQTPGGGAKAPHTTTAPGATSRITGIL